MNEKKEKKIIINADDFGISSGVNNAIANLMDAGSISSTSIMINMPDSSNARHLRLEYPSASIGLHLNLTQGKPLSDPQVIPSLLGVDGYFLSYKELVKKLLLLQIPIRHLKIEIEAQFLAALKCLGNKIDHWDSHQGIHRFEPIFSISTYIARNLSIDGMRTHRHWFVNENYVKPLLSIKDKKTLIKRLFKEIYYQILKKRQNKYFSTPDGILTWLGHNTCQLLSAFSDIHIPKNVILEMPCHPAISIEGLFNTSLLYERVCEYNYLMSNEFNFKVRNEDIIICNYKNLKHHKRN